MIVRMLVVILTSSWLQMTNL